MATDRLVGVDPPGTSCEETAQSRKAPLLLLAACSGVIGVLVLVAAPQLL
jgi:hypothetical protein